jgi:hypothetical protein
MFAQLYTQNVGEIDLRTSLPALEGSKIKPEDVGLKSE